MAACAFDGCSNAVRAKGLCSAHWAQQSKGKPLTALTGCALTRADRFWSKVDKSGEHWMWTGAEGPDGYGVFRDGGKNRGAHRVAWELANGNVPDGLYVLHRCDIRRCVTVQRCLFLGTHADNMDDKMAKGRQAKGPALGVALRGKCNTKLDEESVRQIRRMAGTGVPQREIGAAFGVSQGAITDVVLGRRWGYVT
jgi:hypothetical protein